MTKRPPDDGAIAILVALLSVVLFGFGALVVDIGDAQTVRSQSQNAVDAASLAGVRALAAPGGTVADAVTAVRLYVKENIGVTDWAGCTDPTPLTPAADSIDPSDACISTSDPTATSSFQVRVKLPTRHVPATFGGLFGVSSIGISPVAQALSGQPLPPECGPCDPALDETTGQPTPQPAPTGLPAAIRAMLPDPNDPTVVPAAGAVDANGCPTTPGLFAQPNFPAVVTIGGPGIPVACTLNPGLYVFNDVDLDVAATASIASVLAPQSPTGPPKGTGVTLVFYGGATLTVEGHIGTLLPDGSGNRVPLVASTPDVVWQPGQPIPGVAIVFDQFVSTPPPLRAFTLGDDFRITGSVYGIDGQTTWATNTGDCPAVTSTCVVHDQIGAQSVLATTKTAFSDPDANNIGRIPTVATDHPITRPPLSAPHLVK